MTYDFVMYFVIALVAALALASVVGALTGIPGFGVSASLLGSGLGVVGALLTLWLLPHAEVAGRVRELTIGAYIFFSLVVALATIPTGGATSPVAFIYAVNILVVALLLGLKSALFMATLSLVLHVIMTGAEYFDLLQVAPVWGVDLSQTASFGVYVTFALIMGIVFYIIATVAGRLSDLLAERSHALGVAEELVRQEKLKTEFLTVIAHELRTPLTSARGFLQLAAAGAIPAEQLPATIKRVQNNVETITHHVNELLFVQEMDLVVEQAEDVDLVELARSTLAEYQTHADETQVTLSLKVEGVVKVKGDRTALARAVAALVDNAIKFSPDGGDVTLTIRVGDGQAYFEIQDNGIGVAAEHRPHIFERFYRTDQVGDHVFGGLGLGLSIAQQIVRAHGGEIELGASSQARGSTFTIRLPTDSTIHQKPPD